MLRIECDYPKFLVAHINPAGNYDLYEGVTFEVNILRGEQPRRFQWN